LPNCAISFFCATMICLAMLFISRDLPFAGQVPPRGFPLKTKDATMRTLASFFLLASTLVAPALGQPKADEHSAHHPAVAASAAEMTEGEIRKADKDTKKITIKHGEIKSLDMPPMTIGLPSEGGRHARQVEGRRQDSLRGRKVGYRLCRDGCSAGPVMVCAWMSEAPG
jgi:Cu/Ag efflux protein CusF